MLEQVGLPLFAMLSDHLVVYGDLCTDDLGLGVFERKGTVEKDVALDGLPVHVKDKFTCLTCIFIKVYSGLDATFIVLERDRKDRRDVLESDSGLAEALLVEVYIDGLALGQLLGC